MYPQRFKIKPVRTSCKNAVTDGATSERELVTDPGLRFEHNLTLKK
jgi:hypothetical protein